MFRHIALHNQRLIVSSMSLTLVINFGRSDDKCISFIALKLKCVLSEIAHAI